MKAAPKAVGVDNGGTWIRLVGLDGHGRRVWSLKKPSPSVQELPAFLQQHLKCFHGTLGGLAVGSRGVWKQAARRSVKRGLIGLAKNIVVMSDVEAAWLAAFKSQGIIVISGTGSIAYGKTANGKFARAGGLGPQKSDEGSGYWIGKKWLEGGSARGRGGEGVRKIAQMAPFVIQKAKSRHPTALAIIHQAQHELAKLVVQIARELNYKGTFHLTVSGGVLMNTWFRDGFFKALKQLGIQFTYVPKHVDVAVALAKTFFIRPPAPRLLALPAEV